MLLLDGLNEMLHGSAEGIGGSCGAGNGSSRPWSSARPAPASSSAAAASTTARRCRRRACACRRSSSSRCRTRRSASSLDAYAPSLAAELWAQLTERGQLPLVRSPFLARLLVEQALQEGTRATSQAALITGFVRRTSAGRSSSATSCSEAGHAAHGARRGA
ncbi:MAG: hypothetical protein U0470_10440 [Anaerolineae bacterium]